MGKPLAVIVAPVASQSGYGKHAVDIARSIINLDLFDVKIVPIRWGSTPLNALVPGKDDDIISRLHPTPNFTKQPDLGISLSIPPEFQPFAKYNIGITAGIETTVCNPTWIEGCNRMQLVIVPSKHSKDVFAASKFIKHNEATKQQIGTLEIQVPVEILFEGADTTTYKRIIDGPLEKSVTDELSSIKEDFAFLFVGHWLQGGLGFDRKDVGMMIKTFLETFKNTQNPPALILKTSSAGFSVLDRNEILQKIALIKNQIAAKSFPNVYLLHGQLTDNEMNSLYNHPKVKAMISLTKGEGFGRPLLEFSMTGKPIIASAWSGHLDFLNKEEAFLVGGKLETVHESAVNDFIIKDSQWFTADYQQASVAMQEIFKYYSRYLANSKKMMYVNKEKFSFDMMQKNMKWIFERNLPEFPEELTLKLPKSKTIQLPKIKKLS